jgi:hypothetical protein
MNLLRRSFSTLRTWFGLGDASDERLTPSHGWLLPDSQAVVESPKDGASAPAQPRIL